MRLSVGTQASFLDKAGLKLGLKKCGSPTQRQKSPHSLLKMAIGKAIQGDGTFLQTPFLSDRMT